MLRQASSRNQRSKGFKAKHALQICILVAICIWLLYQVKHSHEKKRAFEERNLKMNKVGDSQADFFKFGRKDPSRIEETVSINETQNKEEEIEETQEEEEEHDSKQEEIEDEEGRADGDDEIDEQDQENGDHEAEHGKESTEEEDKDIHEAEDIHKEVDVFDSQEHEGGTQEAGTQEAREENYKRDDASSAVVHDVHVTESDAGTGGGGNTDEEQVIDKADDDSSANGSKGDNDTSSGATVGENLEKSVQSENVTNGTDDGSKGDTDLSSVSGGAAAGNVSDTITETIQTDNLPSNVTAADNKDVEIEFSKPDNGSVSNSATVESNSQMEQQTNLTTAAESNMPVELQTNSTGGVSDHQPEAQNNSTPIFATGGSMSNDTAGLDASQDQNVAADNAIVGEDSHTSRNVVEQADISDTAVVLDHEEHSAASSTEGESDNSSHPAITEEEKDARTDQSTIPEIQNEVTAIGGEAA